MKARRRFHNKLKMKARTQAYKLARRVKMYFTLLQGV